MNNVITLRNGVEMPLLIQGIPLILGLESISKKGFRDLIYFSFQTGIRAFDTSHDYGKSESYIGYTLDHAMKDGLVRREDVFITSKIGNTQQYDGNIEKCVDDSLRAMKLDYIDLMLLHWPTPRYYINNWRKLEKVYHSGKIRAIGIANCLERHLIEMESSGLECLPHVVQFEYHPFRTVPMLVDYCNKQDIKIQSYTSLCQMIPLVTENILLKELASKYNCTIAQLILAWAVQQRIVPIFRSYNKENIEANTKIFDLKLDEIDMKCIFELNMDYKYHPESLNCPGF